MCVDLLRDGQLVAGRAAVVLRYGVAPALAEPVSRLRHAPQVERRALRDGLRVTRGEVRDSSPRDVQRDRRTLVPPATSLRGCIDEAKEAERRDKPEKPDRRVGPHRVVALSGSHVCGPGPSHAWTPVRGRSPSARLHPRRRVPAVSDGVVEGSPAPHSQTTESNGRFVTVCTLGRADLARVSVRGGGRGRSCTVRPARGARRSQAPHAVGREDEGITRRAERPPAVADRRAAPGAGPHKKS
jgi:hypothetical protein